MSEQAWRAPLVRFGDWRCCERGGEQKAAGSRGTRGRRRWQDGSTQHAQHSAGRQETDRRQDTGSPRFAYDGHRAAAQYGHDVPVTVAGRGRQLKLPRLVADMDS